MDNSGWKFKILTFLSSLNVIIAWLLLIYALEQQGVNHPDFPYIALYFFVGLVFIITNFSPYDPDENNSVSLAINIIFGLIAFYIWVSAYNLIKDETSLPLDNLAIFVPITHIFVIIQIMMSITLLLKKIL